MAGTIYAGTYTSTLLLDNPIQQSPATLTGSVTVSGTTAATDSGFYGIAGDQFSIDNYGRILATGAFAYGIALLGGGHIQNGVGGAALGFIQADEIGVFLTGSLASSVINDGTIIGTNGRGVFLQDGGKVNNGGTNSETATILGGFEGVAIYNPNGLLTNAGTIRDTGIAGFAAQLYNGTIVNGFSAVMSGVYGVGFVAHQGTAATLTNRGTIIGSGRDGVVFTSGGTVANYASISGAIAGVLALYGGASLTNSGNLDGGYSGADFLAGGNLLNKSSGVIQGEFGVSIGNGNSAGALGTVTNYGTITASQYQGISLNEGGTLDNAGSITGVSAGFAAFYGQATVTNSGHITGGAAGLGIYLGAGGTVVNAASGTISAAIGVSLQDGSFGETLSGLVSLSNQGVIAGTGSAGLRVLAGGVVTNQSGGIISGADYGVFVQSVAGTFTNDGTITGQTGFYQRGVVTSGGTVTPDVTLINAGTIIGTGGVAVSLYHSNDLLIDDPGSVFSGNVIGGGARLELAAGGTGTLGVLSGDLSSFGAVTVDAGAVWTGGGTLGPGAVMTNSGTWELTGQTLGLAGTLAGTGMVMLNPGADLQDSGTVLAGATIGFGVAGGTLGLTAPNSENGLLVGFAAGDTLWLPNVPDSGLSENFSNGTLTLSQFGTVIANIAMRGKYTTNSFALVPDGHGGTDVVIPCFVENTAIAMQAGQVPVQSIRPGQFAITAAGRPRRVVWVGQRSLPASEAASAPVCVRAHAFGPDLPVRDLLLSPDHAVFHAGVLIPVHLLVNGTSILRAPRRPIMYHHIELECHDILLAENLPVESYLDTGNRAQFDTPPPPRRRAFASRCAPLVLGGSSLARARRHVLVQRRGNISPPPGWITAALAARPLPPARLTDREAVFLLPDSAREIILRPHTSCTLATWLDGRRWRENLRAERQLVLPLPRPAAYHSLEVWRV